MRQVLGLDSHSDAVTRLQIVTQLPEGTAIASHQHEAVAIAREEMRQFQSYTAGCASNQGRLGREKGIARAHVLVIADFDAPLLGYWLTEARFPSADPVEGARAS